METRNLYLTLLVMESAVLLWSAVQPGGTLPTLPGVILRQGDLEHFVAYAVYGFLMERAMNGFGMGRNRYLYAIAAAGLFAAGTEALQMLVPSRSADVLDWTIDMAGIALGTLTCRVKRGISW